MSEERKVIYYRLTPVYDTDPPSPTRAVLDCAVTGDRLSTTGGGGLAITAHVIDGLMNETKGWNDRDDDFTVAISAAHPVLPSNRDDETRWDLELRARQIVNNRHSKNALIDAVRWLMRRAERAEAALAEVGSDVAAVLTENTGHDELIASTGARIGGPVATEVVQVFRGIADTVKRVVGELPARVKVEAA